MYRKRLAQLVLALAGAVLVALTIRFVVAEHDRRGRLARAEQVLLACGDQRMSGLPGTRAPRAEFEAVLGPPGDFSTLDPVYKSDGPAREAEMHPGCRVEVWNTDRGRLIIPFRPDGMCDNSVGFQTPVAVPPPPWWRNFLDRLGL